MKKSKFLYSLPFKLLVSVALGMGFGLLLNFNSRIRLHHSCIKCYRNSEIYSGAVDQFLCSSDHYRFYCPIHNPAW